MKYAVVFEQYYIGFVTMAIKTHATLQLFFGFFKNIFPGGGKIFRISEIFLGVNPLNPKKYPTKILISIHISRSPSKTYDDHPIPFCLSRTLAPDWCE